MVFARRSHNIGSLVHGEHPQNSAGIGVEVAVLNRKPAISLQRGKNDLEWLFCVKFCFAPICLEL